MDNADVYSWSMDKRTCSIDGCAKPHYARDWCMAHWQRNRKYGTPLGGGPMRQPPRECSVEDCHRKYSARGLCAMHYYRAQRHAGDPLGAESMRTTTSRKPAQPRLCKVSGCGKSHYGRGFCLRHYQRWKDYGDPEAPLRRTRNGTGWRGINNQGYVVLKLRGKTILEHRQVVEDELGRELYQFENVHHKNGIKTDNDPGNLEVWVKVQPCGQRLDDLINLAVFITEHYPAEVKAAMTST